MAYIAGCEIRDHPLRPICKQCREKVAALGNETPIAWLSAEDRYIEKLATPDVTIADMIGDIDPIKAARSGQDISNELTIHYGLVPRANRGIFVVNELPDLAGEGTGRFVQHYAGRRCPNKGLPGAPAVGCRAGFYGGILKTIRLAARSSRPSKTESAAKFVRIIR